MDKVSVIVPVYNKEKELKRCLLSIVTQTYKNLEIIVVDDGSTDESYKIYTKFANEDSRIKIIKKRNEGVDCARHDGIKKRQVTMLFSLIVMIICTRRQLNYCSQL